jgi:DNA-binding MarR family transcriptional regulator
MATKRTIGRTSPPTAPRPATEPAALANRDLLMPGYMPHHMSRLMNLMNMQLLEVLRPLDVTGQQFRVLQVIDARGVTNVGQIARDAVIEQPLVSRVLDQLEERKLARRSKSATNARIVKVSLTQRGREVYAAITPAREAIVADAVSVLSDAERTIFTDLVCRMFQHLSRPLVAPPPSRPRQVSGGEHG